MNDNLTDVEIALHNARFRSQALIEYIDIVQPTGRERMLAYARLGTCRNAIKLLLDGRASEKLVKYWSNAWGYPDLTNSRK